ncbi:cell division protein SepF [Bacillus pacificus]|uniref:cell division protein SepF n=1 Tax=Bacillus pacificus TaxID=2026187 RepID=UPI00094565C2|nr:cell division protein SepF [Bacillus pacificus]MCU5005732.1 cell division protein SepF [Bacillus pacificus]HDR3524228.1 cell division protein SepF [Bacillus pacificus]HDR3634673.1 cell division protein SepF [Bacillus pacificus]HDR7653456.1 cell division protein SepF [Bacillus pacificus]
MTEQLVLLLNDSIKQPDIIQSSPFDIKKADVKQRRGLSSFVDVMAIIPCDVWSADELLPRSTKQDNHFDMYMDYVTAIWRYKRSEDKDFHWDAAERICCEARESQEPQQLRIYLDSGFKPQYVTKYLK